MRFLVLAAGVLAAVQPALAQTSPAAGPTLTLDEAISLARRNNPTYLTTLEGRRRASAALRAAKGNFLPSLDASIGAGFREGREQFFAGRSFGAAADQLSSNYNFQASANYGVATVVGPKLQRANVEAAEADITGSDYSLRANVTQQYLLVLQNQATVALQDTLIASAKAQLQLAQARVAVGAATQLDVQRAEVAFGQAQVASLQARNAVEVEKLRLFQQMGVQQPANAQLTTQFALNDIGVSLDQLVDQARRSNPVLNAQRAREKVAALSYRSAQGQYLPQLNLSASVGGVANQYTDNNYVVNQFLSSKQSNCFSVANIRLATGMAADTSACRAITLTPAEVNFARSTNRAFPFGYTRNPYNLSVGLSLPIFNGFSREQRVQESIAQRNEAQQNVRGTELRLQAEVTAAYLNLTAARQTVALQEQNARTAKSALDLAQERYRVGASSFVDALQARADFERAERDRINAIYDFHRAFASLESAVGRPLR